MSDVKTHYREITLEKLQWGLEHWISDNVLDGSVDIADSIFNNIVVRIRGVVWSERVDIIKFKKPSSWWQMLKEKHAPEWFLERWPVRYDTSIVDVRVAYPDFRPSLPDYRYQWVTTQRETYQ
jgi:hypothetical protein